MLIALVSLKVLYLPEFAPFFHSQITVIGPGCGLTWDVNGNEIWTIVPSLIYLIGLLSDFAHLLLSQRGQTVGVFSFSILLFRFLLLFFSFSFFLIPLLMLCFAWKETTADSLTTTRNPQVCWSLSCPIQKKKVEGKGGGRGVAGTGLKTIESTTSEKSKVSPTKYFPRLIIEKNKMK